MFELLIIITIIDLFVIVLQDFKDNLISVILIIGFGLLTFVYSFFNCSIDNLIRNVIINFSVLFSVLLIILSYYKFLLDKNFSNIKELFGLGDFLLIIFITLLLEPLNFIVFNIVSSIMGLLYYCIVRLINNESKILIPFAGIMAIELIILHVISYFIGNNLFMNNYFYSNLIWI